MATTDPRHIVRIRILLLYHPGALDRCSLQARGSGGVTPMAARISAGVGSQLKPKRR